MFIPFNVDVPVERIPVADSVAVMLLLTRRIESTQDEENLLELFNIQK